jgi:hypothetical protein
MTEEIDLTDHHPCPVCSRVLTDQPLCHYCAETDALRKDLFDANMRAVKLQVRIDFLAEVARAVVVRWDSIDWKNTEHTGAVISRLREALEYVTRRKSESSPCIGNDPLCPCQDGDQCHYQGPDAWPIPPKKEEKTA